MQLYTETWRPSFPLSLPSSTQTWLLVPLTSQTEKEQRGKKLTAGSRRVGINLPGFPSSSIWCLQLKYLFPSKPLTELRQCGVPFSRFQLTVQPPISAAVSLCSSPVSVTFDFHSRSKLQPQHISQITSLDLLTPRLVTCTEFWGKTHLPAS